MNDVPQPYSPPPGRFEIVVRAPRCPNCGSKSLETKKVVANDADGVIRNCTCRTCGKKIRLVIE